MDFTIISFYISLLGMLCMLYIKAREVKRGIPSLLSRLASQTDHIFHAAYDRVVYWFEHLNKRNAIGIAQWVAFHILSGLKKLMLWIQNHAHRNPHTKKVIDMVQGKEQHLISENKSAASVFLKRIAKSSDDVVE